MSYKFIWELEKDDVDAMKCCKDTAITLSCGNDETLVAVLETFKIFLIAVGYSAELVEDINLKRE